jgi:hemerythrin-like domain-containing protein
MTEIIGRLCEEHRNIEQLLLVLERELAVFDRRERPDYEVLQAVVSFFQDSARWHVAREHVVFDALKACDAEAAAIIGGFEIEHGEDPYRLQRLARALTSILGDRDVPRQAFDKAVQDFIAHVRYQIDFEERVLFPSAVKALQAGDWAAIEARLGGGADPSQDRAHEKFGALSEHIVGWEQENLTARA